MNTQRLASILDHFPRLTVCVVGDFFLDKYLIIERTLSETSLETGLEAHQVVEVRCRPGAAGTVTNNLRAMDINVTALTVLGDDGEGYELKRALQSTDVDISAIVEWRDRFTPTYTKPLLRVQGPDGLPRELNRLDIKNREPLPAEVEAEIIHRLRQIVPRVQGVIVGDQTQERNCGVITDRVRDEIAVLARTHPATLFAADSRERIGLFRDVIIKPNAREAARALYPDRESELDRASVEACGAELYRRNGKLVFLTLGAEGILVFHEGGPTHIPACPVRGPIDIVGAGDAAMAGIVAALCSGAEPHEAALIGNLAASITLHQIGTTGTAPRQQIAEYFALLEAG
jgi:rfaE bifunctional protein kinase chain/domain